MYLVQNHSKNILNKKCLESKSLLMAYVMGDGLSSDKMCGRFLAYSKVNRLSWICDVSFIDSDDPQCDCKCISMHFLQWKSNKALKLFGLKDFMENDEVPPLNMLNKLKLMLKKNCLSCLITCITLHIAKFGLVVIQKGLLQQHLQISCMHIVMEYLYMS